MLFFKRIAELISGTSDTVKRDALYRHFHSTIIMHLVRAGAYADFFAGNDFLKKLKAVINDPLIIETGRVYYRTRKTDSLLVPLLIKLRLPRLLRAALISRGKRYIKERGRCSVVRSVYRKGN